MPALCTGCHATRKSPDGDKKLLDQFAAGVHGKALLGLGSRGVPTCADCHQAHSAAKPSAAEIEIGCGRCHSLVRDQFDKSPHAAALKAGKNITCLSCHDGHGNESTRIEMLLGSEPGHCGHCHESGTRGAEVASRLHGLVDSLARKIEATEERIRTAKAEGVFIADEAGYVHEAKRVLVSMTPRLHSLDAAPIADLAERAAAMLAEVDETVSVKSRQTRDRMILSSIVGLLLLLLSVALGLKHRQVVRRREAA